MVTIMSAFKIQIFEIKKLLCDKRHSKFYYRLIDSNAMNSNASTKHLFEIFSNVLKCAKQTTTKKKKNICEIKST